MCAEHKSFIMLDKQNNFSARGIPLLYLYGAHSININIIPQKQPWVNRGVGVGSVIVQAFRVKSAPMKGVSIYVHLHSKGELVTSMIWRH